MCTLLNKCIIFLVKVILEQESEESVEMYTTLQREWFVINRSQNLNMLIYVCLNPFFKVELNIV